MKLRKFIIPCVAAILASCGTTTGSSPADVSSQPAPSSQTSSEPTPASSSDAPTSSSSAEPSSSTGTSSSDTTPEESSSSTPAAPVAVEKVELDHTEAGLYIGEELTLVATVSPANADDKSVTWSSDNTAVATVVNGKVTAITEGKANITVTTVSGAKTAVCAVTVDEALNPSNTIDTLVAPSFIADFKGRVSQLDKVSSIQTNKDPNRSTFYENEEGTADTFRIGTDNAIPFAVKGQKHEGEDVFDEGTIVDIPNPYLSFTLKEAEAGKEWSEITAMGEDAANALVELSNGKLSVKPAAVGKTLQITVQPDASKYYEIDSGLKPIVFEFEAVDGYNVFDAKDLCIFDNGKREGGDPWADIRTERGLADKAPKAIVLQDDISITNEDIPAEFRYTEAEIDDYITKNASDFKSWIAKKNSYREPIGLPAYTEETARADLINSVKDYTTLYERTTSVDEQFDFEGNYHTIDFTKVNQIFFFDDAYEDGDISNYTSEDGSHGQIFGWNSKGGAVEGGRGEGGETNFRNVTVIGNGDRSSDDRYAGGLMTFKIDSTVTNFENIITSKTFITFMSEVSRRDEDKYLSVSIDRCKNFDSYNSLIYIFGTQSNTITNSFMKGAGGGIFLLDEVDADIKDAYHAHPKVDCENVYFENYVTGQEPWFVQKNAGALTTMLAGAGIESGFMGKNAKTHGDHKTIAKIQDGAPLINIIAIDITGRNPLANTVANGTPLEGGISINNNNIESKLDMTAFNSTEGKFANYLNLFNALDTAGQADQAVFFESSAGQPAAMFPGVNNGIMFTNDKFGFTPFTLDNEYKSYAQNINQMMKVMNDQCDIATLDTIPGAVLGSKMLDNFATGDYMNAYIKAAGGTHFLGVLLGTNVIDVE